MKLPTCWKMHRSTSHTFFLHRSSFEPLHRRCAASQPVAGPIGPATRCDAKRPTTRCEAAHLRVDVLKPLRYIKITCDELRCIFQHVGISAPDFGISQLFIIRLSNGLQYCDEDAMPFHVICDSKLSARYF